MLKDKSSKPTFFQHGSLNVPIEHHPTIRYTQNGTVTNPCSIQICSPVGSLFLSTWFPWSLCLWLGPQAPDDPCFSRSRASRSLRNFAKWDADCTRLRGILCTSVLELLVAALFTFPSHEDSTEFKTYILQIDIYSPWPWPCSFRWWNSEFPETKEPLKISSSIVHDPYVASELQSVWRNL